MMTFEEERDYNYAKNSIQKLKPELREQLLKELVGAEAYAAVWTIFNRAGQMENR